MITSARTSLLAGEQVGRRQPAAPGSDAIVLGTKLRPPPGRSDLVARPSLVARLSAASLPKLTLVDAPAGWGKTTLLAEWCAGTGGALGFAWLSLDRADNDPVRFWTYVIEALRTVAPGVGAAGLVLLQAPGTRLADHVLPGLINELEALPSQAVLVLDDYHLVTNVEIHEAMEFLLAHLPETLRLVIATRSDPALPLARLRARGEMTEIRADQLRFSEEETVALLNDALNLDLAAHDVARLRERTEGWAAGLYLAGLSLRGRSDAARFIEAFAGDDRHVVDYLGSEVLDRQPAPVRTFLLRTSILDRLSGPLCDAVTGNKGSARMLEKIERSNLFLVPLDPKREWYRYHHLFGELLRHELERAEPELVVTLHRRACSWHQANGSAPAAIGEAIHHATAAGDAAEAAELIALHWSMFLQHGRLETVSGWLDALPPEIVRDDPRLCLTRAWIAVNTGHLDELDGWIEEAGRAAAGKESEDGAASLEAATAMLRCIHRYMDGHVGEAIQAAREALELEKDARSPWRSVGCPVLGIALFWRGEITGAEGELEEAVRLADPAGNRLAVIHALGCLAAIHAQDGDLGEAERLSQTAIRLSEENGLGEHWVNTLAHVVRGMVLEAQGKLAEADAAVRRGVELSRRGIARVEIAFGLLSLARVRQAQDDPDGARGLLREARRAADECADPGTLVEMIAKAERSLDVPARRRGDGGPQHEGISDRELAVLRLLPTKLSQREIGAELYVSQNTVKTHTRSIFRKLRVSTRAEAVARARQLGLV